MGERMDAYLASLPAGLESYPQCRIKGAAFAPLVKSPPPGLDPSVLPASLRGVLERPPSVTDWVPEVWFASIVHHLRDAVFDTDEAYEAWNLEGMRNTLGGPLYRMRFAFLSPRRMAKMAPRSWSSFRLGSHRTLLEEHPDHNVGQLEYPEHFVDEFYMRFHGRSIEYIYSLSRAKNPRFALLEWTPTKSVFRVDYNVRSG